MAKRFGVTLDTVKEKLPALELAKVRFGIGQAESSKPPSENEASPSASSGLVAGKEVPSSANSGLVAGPVPPVSTSGTSIVPASAQSGAIPVVQGKAGGVSPSEGIEDGEEAEVPTWMKNDGRETVNTIEMAFLHDILAILLSKSRS
jgi:hypothetical protein